MICYAKLPEFLELKIVYFEIDFMGKKVSKKATAGATCG